MSIDIIHISDLHLKEPRNTSVPNSGLPSPRPIHIPLIPILEDGLQGPDWEKVSDLRIAVETVRKRVGKITLACTGDLSSVGDTNELLLASAILTTDGIPCTYGCTQPLGLNEPDSYQPDHGRKQDPRCRYGKRIDSVLQVSDPQSD